MYSMLERTNLTPRELVESLLGEAIRRVNAGVSKTLTARRTTELPPKSSRHLTDTRTRVSTLLEYSLAYEMNHILEEDGQGYSVSAVLWNVFPDLLVRNKQRVSEIGLEVKALHTAAEEKSANLMTPLQLIRRNRDFVVIVNWGWQVESQDGTSITYPHIHLGGVFDAWLLAKIRDYGWLFKQGDRIKGVDLATPVINGSGNNFKSEEGNMGKLMRIELPSDIPNNLPDYAEMNAEAERYGSFKQHVLALGLRETFLDLCLIEGAQNPTLSQESRYPNACKVLGEVVLPSGVDFRLIAGARPETWLRSEADIPTASVLLWLSAKLEWRIFRKQNTQWSEVGAGKKPDSDLELIRCHLTVAV